MVHIVLLSSTKKSINMSTEETKKHVHELVINNKNKIVLFVYFEVFFYMLLHTPYT